MMRTTRDNLLCSRQGRQDGRREEGSPCRFSARCSAAASRRPPTKLSDPVEYKGYIIRASPYKNNGQYQTAGVIARDVSGEREEHRFIRADTYASYDDAVTFTINKARQIIDLQGERIFD